MTNTTKTAILAILVIATALSGCIGNSDTPQDDATIEHMVHLEAILTDPEFSEDNAEMMAKASTDIEAITGEKYELKANVTPTAIATPEPKLPNCYRLLATIDTFYWDDSVITLVILETSDHHGIHGNFEWMKIYVDGQNVATLDPIIDKVRYEHSYYIIDCPITINLPDGLSSTGEITATAYTIKTPHVEAGEYPIGVQVRTPPEEYEEKYNEYSVYNP